LKNELWPSAKLLKAQFAYAIPFSAAVLIEIIRSQLHMYAVSSRYDAAMFAIYAVGCLQIPLVDFMMTSTSNVLMVKMQEYIQAGDKASILEIWHDTTRKLLLIFVPLVGSLLVVADKFIIVLFTKSYTASVPLFMIWTVTILFSTLLTDSFLRTYAKTGYLIVLNLIQLMVIVGTIEIFMKLFGMAGAVISTLLAIAVAKCVAILKIRSILKSSLSQVLPWNSIAITLVIGVLSAIPALFVKSVLTIPNIPLVIVAGMTYVGTYICLLLLSGLLSLDERKTIMALVKWPLTRTSRI
jgi:O-antigen/teichoic acid export membrane protein